MQICQMSEKSQMNQINKMNQQKFIGRKEIKKKIDKKNINTCKSNRSFFFI